MLSWFSHVQLFATLWTVARQASLSTGFSRQEYWSGLPCPPPEDLPDPEIEPKSLMSSALAGRFFTTSTTWHQVIIPSLFDMVFVANVQVSAEKQNNEENEVGCSEGANGT